MTAEGIITGALCAVVVASIPILWWRSHLRSFYRKIYVIQPEFDELVNDFVESEQYRRLATFAILNGAAIIISKEGFVTFKIETVKTARGREEREAILKERAD